MLELEFGPCRLALGFLVLLWGLGAYESLVRDLVHKGVYERGSAKRFRERGSW